MADVAKRIAIESESEDTDELSSSAHSGVSQSSGTSLAVKQLEGAVVVISAIVALVSTTVTFTPNVLGDQLCNIKVDPDNPNYKGYKLMTLAVAGASAWSCMIQLLRISIEVKKATRNGKAISWLAFLTTFVMTAQQFQNVAYKTPLCNDHFGLLTPFYQWFEWMVSVPMMVYLTITLDPYKDSMHSEDVLVLLLTELTIFVASFTVVYKTYNANIILVSVATITMISFLAILLSQSYDGFVRASAERESESRKIDNVRECTYQLACKKFCATIYLSVALPLFPIIFLLGWSKVVDTVNVVTIVTAMNFLCKHVFALILTEFHMDKLDINRVAVMGEKAADTARNQFVRYVFHEVRVPLNSLTMGLHLLKTQGPQMKEEVSNTMEVMSEAIHNMGETLNDVLSIQKIEEGKLALSYDMLEVSALTKNMHKRLSPLFRGRKLKFVVKKSSRVPKAVLGDKFRLEHMLTNIVSNAIKMSAEGGTVTISVTTLNAHTAEHRKLVDNIREGDSDDDQFELVCWSITDEGEALSPEVQRSIFDKYNLSASSIGGGWVSLAICKEVVSGHGGTIIINSNARVRKGNEIRVIIPFKVVSAERITTASVPASGEGEREGTGDQITVVPTTEALMETSVHEYTVELAPEAGEAPPKSPSSTETGEAPASVPSAAKGASSTQSTRKSSSPASMKEFKPRTVMVVDDVASNRKLLTMLMKRFKHLSIESAACGAEALKMFDAQPHGYDLIFMDNIMPDMSGLEVSHSLRTKKNYKNLIIGVTGNSLDRDLKEFVEAGADIALPKPMRYGSIVSIIEHLEKYGGNSIKYAKQDAHEVERAASLQEIESAPL